MLLGFHCRVQELDTIPRLMIPLTSDFRRSGLVNETNPPHPLFNNSLKQKYVQVLPFQQTWGFTVVVHLWWCCFLTIYFKLLLSFPTIHSICFNFNIRIFISQKAHFFLSYSILSIISTD